MFDRRKGQGYIEVMVVVAVLLIITLFAIPRYQDLRRDAYRAQIANDSKLVETYTIEHYFYEGDMPVGSKVISDSELKELVNSKRSYLKGDIINSTDIDAIGGKKHILDKEEVLKHVNTKLKGDFIYTGNGVMYVDNAKANNDTEKPGESKPKPEPEPVDQTDLIKKIEDDIENLANTDDKDEGYGLMDSIPKEIKEIIDKDEQGKLNKNYEEALEVFLSKFLGPVKQVASGSETYSAALTEDGDLYTWGIGTYGKLGHGNTINFDIPKKVRGISNVKQVELGHLHSAAITEDGSLYTWGRNLEDQLGHGDMRDKTIPTKVKGLSNVKQVALGGNHSAAITENGDLYMWGSGNNGQLGFGYKNRARIPTKVKGISNVKQVSLGFFHSAAITEDGELYTWGKNNYGQLGLRDTKDRNVPTKVVGIPKVKQITLGGNNLAVVMEDDNLYILGDGRNGQLGDLIKREDLYDIKKAIIGESHIAVITNNGDLYTWGKGSDGKLGHGNRENSNIPTKVKNLTNIKDISLGRYHSIAITEDGKLYTWGRNNYGQLGHVNPQDKLIPIQVERCRQ